MTFIAIRPSGRGVTLTPEKLARRIANFCEANNINSDTDMENYINGLSTLAQVRSALREVLVALTDHTPPQNWG